jgi:hypothetical protein
MSIKRGVVCLIVVSCILAGGRVHAAACDRTPCPAAAVAEPSPIERLKSLFGAQTGDKPPPQAAPSRPSAKKREPRRVAIPLPRPRPPTLHAGAFPQGVFAAVAPTDAEDSAGPARLVDDAFNEIAVHDDDQYPGLKSAMGALRGRSGSPPAP